MTCFWTDEFQAEEYCFSDEGNGFSYGAAGWGAGQYFGPELDITTSWMVSQVGAYGWRGTTAWWWNSTTHRAAAFYAIPVISHDGSTHTHVWTANTYNSFDKGMACWVVTDSDSNARADQTGRVLIGTPVGIGSPTTPDGWAASMDAVYSEEQSPAYPAVKAYHSRDLSWTKVMVAFQSTRDVGGNLKDYPYFATQYLFPPYVGMVTLAEPNTLYTSINNAGFWNALSDMWLGHTPTVCPWAVTDNGSAYWVDELTGEERFFWLGSDVAYLDANYPNGGLGYAYDNATTGMHDDYKYSGRMAICWTEGREHRSDQVNVHYLGDEFPLDTWNVGWEPTLTYLCGCVDNRGWFHAFASTVWDATAPEPPPGVAGIGPPGDVIMYWRPTGPTSWAAPVAVHIPKNKHLNSSYEWVIANVPPAEYEGNYTCTVRCAYNRVTQSICLVLGEYGGYPSLTYSYEDYAQLIVLNSMDHGLSWKQTALFDSRAYILGAPENYAICGGMTNFDIAANLDRPNMMIVAGTWPVPVSAPPDSNMGVSYATSDDGGRTWSTMSMFLSLQEIWNRGWNPYMVSSDGVPNRSTCPVLRGGPANFALAFQTDGVPLGTGGPIGCVVMNYECLDDPNKHSWSTSFDPGDGAYATLAARWKAKGAYLNFLVWDNAWFFYDAMDSSLQRTDMPADGRSGSSAYGSDGLRLSSGRVLVANRTYYSDASGAISHLISYTDDGALWKTVDAVPYPVVSSDDEFYDFVSLDEWGGTVYYMYTIESIEIAKSLDNGRTWEHVSSSGTKCYAQKLMVNDSGMYAWVLNSTQDAGAIWHSTDGGATWNAIVSSEEWGGNTFLNCPNVKRDKHGNIHALYSTYDGTTHALRYRQIKADGTVVPAKLLLAVANNNGPKSPCILPVGDKLLAFCMLMRATGATGGATNPVDYVTGGSTIATGAVSENTTPASILVYESTNSGASWSRIKDAGTFWVGNPASASDPQNDFLEACADDAGTIFLFLSGESFPEHRSAGEMRYSYTSYVLRSFTAGASFEQPLGLLANGDHFFAQRPQDDSLRTASGGQYFNGSYNRCRLLGLPSGFAYAGYDALDDAVMYLAFTSMNTVPFRYENYVYDRYGRRIA